VAAIHGNKSQSQRERALAAFRASKIRALVATDIAARGIDVDQVTHVVNYELPDVAETYVHRIGRTARAGAHGTAISLCGADERDQLRDIERLTRQSIPSEDRRHARGSPPDAPPPRRGQSRARAHRPPGRTAPVSRAHVRSSPGKPVGASG
jgi:ATP-dependent RNA helicase RhlE